MIATEGHKRSIRSARSGRPGCCRTICTIGRACRDDDDCEVGARLRATNAPPRAAISNPAPKPRARALPEIGGASSSLTEHLALSLFHFVGIAAMHEPLRQGAEDGLLLINDGEVISFTRVEGPDRGSNIVRRAERNVLQGRKNADLRFRVDDCVKRPGGLHYPGIAPSGIDEHDLACRTQGKAPPKLR